MPRPEGCGGRCPVTPSCRLPPAQIHAVLGALAASREVPLPLVRLEAGDLRLQAALPFAVTQFPAVLGVLSVSSAASLARVRLAVEPR